MEHLMNCHGEWVTIFSVLANLPLIGYVMRNWMGAKKHTGHDQES